MTMLKETVSEEELFKQIPWQSNSSLFLGIIMSLEYQD